MLEGQEESVLGKKKKLSEQKENKRVVKKKARVDFILHSVKIPVELSRGFYLKTMYLPVFCRNVLFRVMLVDLEATSSIYLGDYQVIFFFPVSSIINQF